MVEIEAPASGVLIRILAEPNRVIPVGGALGEINADDDAPFLATAPDAGPAPMPAAVSAARSAGSFQATSVQSEPRARRLAKETGVDLATVRGTGPNGRITEIDVRRAVESTAARDEVRALTGVRGVIARRMLESLRSMAQLTLHSEADVSELVARRGELPQGERPSITTLLIRAAAVALRDHPHCNATLENGEIRLHKTIDIGVATHVDKGLLVPVLRDVAVLSSRTVAERLATLTVRARSGALKPADLAGGTFTITNLGAFGIDAFTPIIQPPQVAILGVGRIKGRYSRGAGGPVWREYLTLSLTFDHRALDGVPAAGFLQTVAHQLAAPGELFG
jgi:pyruvate dehydrogenase E2 component (dihydrolipoamide acetyltransferase)